MKTLKLISIEGYSTFSTPSKSNKLAGRVARACSLSPGTDWLAGGGGGGTRAPALPGTGWLAWGTRAPSPPALAGWLGGGGGGGDGGARPLPPALAG